MYVTHSTAGQVWPEYLAKHAPPAHRHFRVGSSQIKALTAAIGTTGAPTYVLLDGEGKAVALPAPKPEDPLLVELVGKQF